MGFKILNSPGTYVNHFPGILKIICLIIINLHCFCPINIAKVEEIPVAQFYSNCICDLD